MLFVKGDLVASTIDLHTAVTTKEHIKLALGLYSSVLVVLLLTFVAVAFVVYRRHQRGRRGQCQPLNHGCLFVSYHVKCVSYRCDE